MFDEGIVTDRFSHCPRTVGTLCLLIRFADHFLTSDQLGGGGVSLLLADTCHLLTLSFQPYNPIRYFG